MSLSYFNRAVICLDCLNTIGLFYWYFKIYSYLGGKNDNDCDTTGIQYLIKLISIIALLSSKLISCNYGNDKKKKRPQVAVNYDFRMLY